MYDSVLFNTVLFIEKPVVEVDLETSKMSVVHFIKHLMCH